MNINSTRIVKTNPLQEIDKTQILKNRSRLVPVFFMHKLHEILPANENLKPFKLVICTQLHLTSENRIRF